MKCNPCQVYNPDWIKQFELRGVGLPVESNGEWQVPDGEKALHASGHASGSDLLKIAHEIRPEVLIPVHSEYPSFYVDQLRDSGIRVVLPSVGATIEI